MKIEQFFVHLLPFCIVSIRLLPHHNNVRTTTVIVVVVHTPHSIPKNDRNCTVIRTSKCTVQMMTKQNRNSNFFLNFLEVSRHLNSAGAEKKTVCGCGQQPH